MKRQRSIRAQRQRRQMWQGIVVITALVPVAALFGCALALSVLAR